MNNPATVVPNPFDGAVIPTPSLTDDGEKQVLPLESETRQHSPFDDLTKLRATGVFWRSTMMCVFAGLCILMEGYQGTVTGSIVSNVGFIDQFGKVQPNGKKALEAVYVSAWGGTSGAFQLAGQQIATIIADRYGRMTSFYIATVLICAGVLLESFVGTMGGWLGAKIVAGFAAGMGQSTGLLASSLASKYIAEMSPKQTRGALLCCYGLFLAIGQLTSAIALEVINVSYPYKWRRAVYSEWVMVGAFALCLPWMRETPWYYARKGLDDRARRTMSRIYSGVKGYDVEHEYNLVKIQIELEKSHRKSQQDAAIKEVFQGTNLRRTLSSFFGVVILQWSGASVVFSYATYFLQQAGIKQPFQATCIVYSLLVFMVIVSFYTTERFGRRPLILTGGAGCFICNIIIGSLGTRQKTDAVLNATLGVICVWVVIYAGCLAGVGWGLTTEIATARLRARTAGVVINGSQCFSILFGYVVPLMLGSVGNGARNWGTKTLFLFAVTGALASLINYFILPEVRGRSYAELDEMFEAGIPARKTKNFRSSVQKGMLGETSDLNRLDHPV